MQQQMTAEQAFSIIDQVCAKFQGTRQDHQLLLEAIETLKKSVVQVTPEVAEIIPPSEVQA